MPRNGSGTYTLPRPPFTPGTVISSADVNADFSDIATALTGSVAVNGETVLTGQIRGILGANPAFSFVGDIDTGFGSEVTDEAYIRAGGVKTVNVTATGLAVTGTGVFSAAVTVTAGGLTVTAGGITVSAGGITVTGNSTITGLVTLVSTSHMTVPIGTTAQRPGVPAAGNLRYNSTTGELEWFNGTWSSPGRQQTTTVLTGAGAGVYNTPPGARQLRIRMIAGGGGGAGATANAGVDGGNTSFTGAHSVLGGAGGQPGGGSAGGAGGTGGNGGAGVIKFRIQGSDGTPGMAGGGVMGPAGGNGGTSPFGGSGRGGFANSAGVIGKANSGSGGGAGASSNGLTGGGGGSGEYGEQIINTPVASYNYTIGGGGAGGAGGTQPGANGGSGIIIVDEYY